MGFFSGLGNFVQGAASIAARVASPIIGAVAGEVPGVSIARTAYSVGSGFLPGGAPANSRVVGGGFDEPGFDLNPFDAFNEVPEARVGGRTIFDAPAATATPRQEVCYRCPKGYVLVTDPRSGAKTCILKCVARQMGVWKARPKPPISAADARHLRIAETTKRKAKRIASRAGFTCITKGRGRKK